MAKKDDFIHVSIVNVNHNFDAWYPRAHAEKVLAVAVKQLEDCANADEDIEWILDSVYDSNVRVKITYHRDMVEALRTELETHLYGSEFVRDRVAREKKR